MHKYKFWIKANISMQNNAKIVKNESNQSLIFVENLTNLS